MDLYNTLLVQVDLYTTLLVHSGLTHYAVPAQ